MSCSNLGLLTGRGNLGVQPEAMDVMLEGVENLNADGDEDVVVPTTAQDALNAFEAKEAAAQVRHA